MYTAISHPLLHNAYPQQRMQNCISITVDNIESVFPCDEGKYVIKNVTGFGKMCIVHTSDFAHLEVHKNHKQWCKHLKLSGLIKQ